MNSQHFLRTLSSKFFLLTTALVLWVVIVLLTYDLALNPFNFSKGALLLAVTFLVGGVVSQVAIRLVARPLRRLQDGILLAQQGQLEPIKVVKTGDEIEFLGNSFNKMIETLRSTQKELLTNQQELENRIRQRTFELEIAMQSALAASQAKSDFLANMSHELRTPLNGVLGMIDMVLETELNSEQRECLETARQCAYSLLAGVNDVLDISKIEAGHMALECVSFDLRLLLTDAWKTLSGAAALKQIGFELSLADEVPSQVSGDPLRLRQIVSNLLSNAIKFTEQGGVRLRVERERCAESDKIGLAIHVIDTGIGIEESKQEHIFEKFTQADTSISRRFGGSGLGLAIVQSLVQMHGGCIDLESAPGRGSTFTVHLQLQHPRVADVPEQPNESINRILVVEDNKINQKLVCSLLRKNGYTPVLAQNGAEALTALENQSYGLVLMDVEMPVIDGIETTRRIRVNERWAKLPIVAMTARAMDGDEQVCLEAGMNGFITKPINASHLLSVVETYTGNQSSAVQS